jgi:hypothetical protein
MLSRLSSHSFFISFVIVHLLFGILHHRCLYFFIYIGDWTASGATRTFLGGSQRAEDKLGLAVRLALAGEFS